MALSKDETIILIVIFLAAVMILGPHMYNNNGDNDHSCEGFSEDQENDADNTVDRVAAYNDVMPNDPANDNMGRPDPYGSSKVQESLIHDYARGTVESGSDFMRNTGIVAPLWIKPAWEEGDEGPYTDKDGNLVPADFENDPRMLYNKCSISCCSPQYPTPFQGSVDPFMCDKDGKSKYLSSSYNCTNNTGGTGCLCMTEKQSNGMQNGWVGYYSNKERGL